MTVKRLLNKNEEIINKWKLFVKEGILNKQGIRDVIYESWKRSKECGINPFVEEFSVRLEKHELDKRYKQFAPLLDMAKPFMDSLYKLVKDTDFIIRLTDRDGYVLAHIGEEKLINMYSSLGLYDGYNVTEEASGTNAIGIALITGKPIQVLGGEHYIQQHHKLTSSACPIKDKNEQILGVLSITGNYELVHPHTLGMVIAAAEAIEREIKLEERNKELKLTNERFYEITESISEGIIKVDNKGCIVSINRFAKKLLSFKEKDVIGKNFKHILSSDNTASIIRGISNCRKYEEEEIYFKTRTGRKKTCITNVTPIKVDKRLEGVVITFREVKMVHSMINKIVGANAKFTFNDILGNSESIKKAIKLASISAKSNTTILLQGESGTGKEMFAQSIHNESDRRDYPFVFLNCGAIPRELVSSELFGYIEGAFTGAKRGGHPGKFELADGGTIFLDEIGDMPLDAQVSLLRVLEDRKVVRVGGHDVIPIDVRVIAATNKDLSREVEIGNFRSDLFYRINVMTINTPSLRERKDDIRIFIDYFLEKFSKNTGKNIKGISQRFYQGMINYNWPGNVRELQNVMQTVINVAENNTVLTHKNLPRYIRPKEMIDDINFKNELLTLEEVEKNTIVKTIQGLNGNIAAAAKILGIGRSTMYRKMKKYNIEEV
ncbi:sigma-54-dependent Fis family transcriptional regulator [Clostridium ganghwense]|uniref:Sigma-54-dependent Fis family transcriptional regulator n=1 Tax=Clostridium ganghwense TaxID=312089 RepID=A0ABT4CSM5_9CLOT|nr:sigma-54-dependent Fis family transcriptional regulator [Clostridium ganghwense]MCY6372057.1 sigma-54-dependent Fis family transcriptional regulator [Clostridium ganghwense]